MTKEQLAALGKRLARAEHAHKSDDPEHDNLSSGAVAIVKAMVAQCNGGEGERAQQNAIEAMEVGEAEYWRAL